MTNFFEEAVGWLGMSAILLAYALNSFGILSSESIVYQTINIIGSIGIGYISFKKKAYQPGVLNVLWTGIAAIAIGKILM